MINYKPVKVRTSNNKMYGNVNMTAWSFGGQPIIDTKFEEQAIINSGLDRKLPEASMLDYQAIPTVANYGSVKINPAGMKVWVGKTADGKKDELKYTQNLVETVIQANNAENYLRGMQYTDLDILNLSIPNQVNNISPIAIFHFGLMYSTLQVIKPIIYHKRLTSLLEIAEGFSQTAGYRVQLMKNAMKRSKYIKPYQTYISILGKTKLHAQTVETVWNFAKLEKLNDAFNTSIDYVDLDLDIETGVQEAMKVKWPRTVKYQSIVPLVTMSGKVTTTDLFTTVYRVITADINDLNKTSKDGYLEQFDDMLNELVTGFNTAVAAMTSMTTLYAPYYAALPRMSEYMDLSVFQHMDLDNKPFEVRKSSFYSKGNMLQGVTLTPTPGPYPTYTAKIPLFNGSLLPDETFARNGLLFIKSTDTDLYVPYVDISNMKAETFIFYTGNNFNLSDYISIDKKDITQLGHYTEYILHVETDTASLVKCKPVKTGDVNYETVIYNPFSSFVHYLLEKTDAVAIYFKDGTGAFVLKSVNVTGARQVSYVGIEDLIVNITVKATGFKSMRVS